MFSIELLDAQTGDRKTNAEVCFTESDGRQKYVRRDEAHDRGFKQLFIAFGITSSEEDYERKLLTLSAMEGQRPRRIVPGRRG